MPITKIIKLRDLSNAYELLISHGHLNVRKLIINNSNFNVIENTLITNNVGKTKDLLYAGQIKYEGKCIDLVGIPSGGKRMYFIDANTG